MREDKHIVDKKLFEKHIIGNVSSIQKRNIDNWVRESKANEDLFYLWLYQFEKENPQYQIDVEGALEQFKESLLRVSSKNNDTLDSPNKKPDKLYRLSRYVIAIRAAVVVISLLLGAWLSQKYWYYKEYSTGIGEHKKVNLDDGSVVMLNENSILQVPRLNLFDADRWVHIQGEAFFSVKHTKTNQLFFVQTSKNFEVEVLGTEFSIFAREGFGRISLNRGKIRLRINEDKTIKKLDMTPGEIVEIRNETKVKVTKSFKTKEQFIIKGNKYILEETTLQEIATFCQETYGLTVVVESEDLKKQTLSGSFIINDANSFLNIIENVLDVKVIRINENTVQIISKTTLE
jgi:transmembrane sensor